MFCSKFFCPNLWNLRVHLLSMSQSLSSFVFFSFTIWHPLVFSKTDTQRPWCGAGAGDARGNESRQRACGEWCIHPHRNWQDCLHARVGLIGVAGTDLLFISPFSLLSLSSLSLSLSLRFLFSFFPLSYMSLYHALSPLTLPIFPLFSFSIQLIINTAKSIPNDVADAGVVEIVLEGFQTYAVGRKAAATSVAVSEPGEHHLTINYCPRSPQCKMLTSECSNLKL